VVLANRGRLLGRFFGNQAFWTVLRWVPWVLNIDPSLKRSLGLFKWYFCQFGRTVSKTSRTISKCVQDHS
jgi:hypothetical protein